MARVLHGTRAEGPGLRTAIWVQGCSIRCAGCINPHLFSARGGSTQTPQEIVSGAVDAGVEGLTFLGGEPFDQAYALAEVAELAHSQGLGIITFTGYTYEHLLGGSSGTRKLIEATDLLVDGPYQKDAPEEGRALVGSSNQRFLHLTQRYGDFDEMTHPNRVDVKISPDGSIEMAGFLQASRLQEFSRSVGPRVNRKGSSSS
ncbi:4Fe-4S single cluster domain-containing protein [Clavibacter michiganensis]|uniref:4Fe-4S single cluster domain-containing protein n=1 Tax=Clavibacter michiganensis TaxID=28447 RepID=UPI002157D9E5|nr:4Fe-4S single cluster domain-containing protein [Clavibacter michiganensis]